MAYLEIKDFKFGMDRRRRRVTGVPGTLWTLNNAHITRGGDIERCKKFVPSFTLPSGQTKGLAALRGQVYVFGTAASVSVPSGVRYQRIESAYGSALKRVLDAKGFDGKLYVVAEYEDGSVHHFYDGVRISDWGVVADAAAEIDGLASYMANKLSGSSAVSAVPAGNLITITARTPGAAFTYSATSVNRGAVNDQGITFAVLQPNVPAVAEVQAKATIKITGGNNDPRSTISSILAGTTQLLDAPLQWRSSNGATALRLASAINKTTLTHGYVATAIGENVQVRAPVGQGAVANFRAFAVTTTGSASVFHDTVFDGGVTTVAAVAQVVTATFTGTFEPSDTFTITIDGVGYSASGRASATGLNAFVFKKRLWSPAGTLLRFCKLSTPTDWTTIADTSTDAGFINVSSETEGTDRLLAAAEYNAQAAVFASESIRIFNLAADLDQVGLAQSLYGTGTIAARSVRQYGSQEVYYLDRSGIRSLKSRDSINTPMTDDIGSPIDPFVLDHLKTLTDAQIENACSVIEPEDGRFLLALGGYVFALSQFPRAKINAWSMYDLGFSIDDFARTGRKLYARSGDTIYLYGGESGLVYPNASEQTVSLKTPFMAAEKVATIKEIYGIDSSVVNVWDSYLLVDPNDETKKIAIGRLHNSTYAEGNIAMPGRTSHVALEMTCTAAGAASVSNVAIHFDGVEAR
jgi:hypothetical protein